MDSRCRSTNSFKTAERRRTELLPGTARHANPRTLILGPVHGHEIAKDLSLGPDLPIEDDEVHVWTASLDEHFSHGKSLVTVAAGNTGDAEWDLGNARIQAPADGANVLAVGACDSMDDAWQRAGYSSIGPGRSPGIVKPEIVVFGGCDATPFLVLDAAKPGLLAASSARASHRRSRCARRDVGVAARACPFGRPLFERADLLGHTQPEYYLWPACQWGRDDATNPMLKWDTAWRALRDAAGLPGLRFHDLRHTVTTELAEMGVADHVLESISGHLSRRMLEHYSHIRIDAKRQALDALDAARRSTAHNGNDNGDGANQTEISAIVEVSDDLASQSRHSLRLSGSPPHGKLLIPLERRDVRVVEGARLESNSGDAYRVILEHLFAQSIQRIPAAACVSM